MTEGGKGSKEDMFCIWGRDKKGEGKIKMEETASVGEESKGGNRKMTSDERNGSLFRLTCFILHNSFKSFLLTYYFELV